MKKYIPALILFGAFTALLAVLTVSALGDAREMQRSVFRFHIVANSDSDEDQQNKTAVRDGIAQLCSELFSGCPDKQSSMAAAEQNKELIRSRAEQILLQNGCPDSVEVRITQRFFPTKSYDGVALPAGVYDTLDIRIGKAEGENFFCVMFPDICLGSSRADTNRKKLGSVLTDGAYNMATNTKSPTVRFKFKAVELFYSIKNLLFAQK